MPFTHSVNLGAPPSSFSEVDMFLQSLTSEDSSDADSYDFFSPDSQGMRQASGSGSVSGRGGMGPGAFEPQYLHSQGQGQGQGFAQVQAQGQIQVPGQISQGHVTRNGNGNGGVGVSSNSSSAAATAAAAAATVTGHTHANPNPGSFGSSSSSDPYNNYSPFDLSDTELRPSITNDTDSMLHVMIKSESDPWANSNNKNNQGQGQGQGPISLASAGIPVAANSMVHSAPQSSVASGLPAGVQSLDAMVSPADSLDSRPSPHGGLSLGQSLGQTLNQGHNNMGQGLNQAQSLSQSLSQGQIQAHGSGSGLTSVQGKVGKPKKERTSHNVIEKKYRTNINNKIVQLKEIIPSLCVTMKREEGIPVTELDQIRLDGLQPAKKLNKASILVKTIEYIQHLEGKVEKLKAENDQLKQSETFSTPLSVRNNSTSESLHHSQQHQAARAQAPIRSGSSTSSSTSTSASDVNISGDPTIFTNAYPTSNMNNNNNNHSFRNKMLLGGIAMSMGANCFGGDSSDFSTVRGLMAMPVFHYSPMEGFTLSNSNGNINLFSSFISLFRLCAFFGIIVQLMSQIMDDRKSAGSKGGNSSAMSDIVVNYVDSLRFTSNSEIVETLKKTLFLNRLKYPENSMERIQNEILKCYAIKLWKSPFKILFSGHVEKTWDSLSSKVNKINSKPSTITENPDWKAISYILKSDVSEALGNEPLLAQITENKDGFNLSSFVQFVYRYNVQQKVESAMNATFEASLNDTTSVPVPVSEAQAQAQATKLERIYLESIKDNKELQSLGVSTSLDCIFHPNARTVKELTDKLKVDKSLLSEDERKDIIRILHSTIISAVVADKKFDEVSYWVSRFPTSLVDQENMSLLSVTALFFTIKRILDKHKNIDDISKVSAKLEYISGKLRIWVGSKFGSCLQLDTRGKLVDFFVDSALKFNSLVESDGEEEEYEGEDEEEDEADSLFDEDDEEEEEDDEERKEEEKDQIKRETNNNVVEPSET